MSIVQKPVDKDPIPNKTLLEKVIREYTLRLCHGQKCLINQKDVRVGYLLISLVGVTVIRGLSHVKLVTIIWQLKPEK